MVSSLSHWLWEWPGNEARCVSPGMQLGMPRYFNMSGHKWFDMVGHDSPSHTDLHLPLGNSIANSSKPFNEISAL